MVRIEQRGAYVFATLDAPATRNALTDEMVSALAEPIELAEASATTRALVIRGANGTFCAGGDFSRFRELMAAPLAPTQPDSPAPADPIAKYNRAFGRLLERLRDCAVPTVAVVEGAAMGGGAGLAAACDFVIASQSAQFAMPEVTLGLPPAQIAPFIAARIGAGAALRLMSTGRRIDAPTAHSLHLVDEVHAPDALEARVGALLTELGRAEPAVLRATKSIVRRSQGGDLGATLDDAAGRFAAALRSGTASEGLAAFAGKRPANWVVRPEGAQ